MDELVQWLRAQLDEDERDARARRGIFPSPAVNDDGSVCLHVRPGGNMAITWYRHPAEGWDDMAKLRNWADAKHGWTQERVVREIDAKRQILDQCAYWNKRAVSEAVDPPKFPQPGLDLGLLLDAMNPVLRLLALPYADRPGYREEWRP